MKTYPEYPNLFVVDHPVVQDKLTKMRDKDCPFSEFRALLQKISKLMAYPVTENMAMGTRKIMTPLIDMDAPCLMDKDPVIVPILRAGLGLVDGLLDVFSDAIVGHVGIYRDHGMSPMNTLCACQIQFLTIVPLSLWIRCWQPADQRFMRLMFYCRGE